jgi:NitT/TauT family transport system ATP-binding protein
MTFDHLTESQAALGGADGRPTAIDLKGVSKTFKTKTGSVQALGRVDAQVPEGEFLCVVGPSGCGKSTILKIISGLLPPSEGSVEVFGERVTGTYRDVGFVFQNPVLLKWRTVLDNVLFPIEILRLPRRKFVKRAQELLELVGLGAFESSYPHQLSGGMQQRAAIARALIHDPRLLLMDEPFGALDQITREQMNIELARIWAETGKTTVLITHSIEEAVFLGDRVMVMAPRPSRVASVVPVDLMRPRRGPDRQTPAFNEIERRVDRALAVSFD